jgi:hypothetical protein
MSTLTVTLIVIGGVVLPQAATAGTYVVRGCWTTNEPGGWVPLDGAPLGTFSQHQCPEADLKPWPMGLGAVAASGAYVRDVATGWVFSAPPGTQIVAVTAEAQGPGQAETHPNAWSRGLWDPDTGSWLALPAIRAPGPWNAVSTPAIASRRVALGLRCRADPCLSPVPGDDPKAIAWAAFRRIAVTVRDDASPAITLNQSLPNGWLNRERPEVSFTSADNVGVLWTEASLDGRRIAYAPRGCYDAATNTSPSPCATTSTPALTVAVDASGLTDGTHTLVLSAGDVAGNVSQDVHEIAVDHNAPAAPRGTSIAAGGGWRRENRFDVSWVNPPEKTAAPIAGARYQLCPADNDPYAQEGCVAGGRDGTGISGIEALSVPRDGTWTLRLALVDSAGNHDEKRDTTFEPLRLDSGTPEIAFETFDERDPGRIRVKAHDPVSGVANVEIEAKRKGTAAWQALPVAGTGEQFAALMDDEQLAAGTYDLRARVVDHAGNERTVTTLPGGFGMGITLPVRAATTMVVGETRRVRVKGSRGRRPKYRQVIVDHPSVNFGKVVTVRGRLSDDAGNPRADSVIDVSDRVELPGMEWRWLATIRSDSKGEFVLRANPGPARVLRFAYPGSATTRPGADEVRLRVRAGATLTPSRRRVRNGQAVVFRGRVVGGPIPEAGKLVLLQARTSQGWRTFATPRANPKGHWSHRYRFTGTPTTARYSFRALVPVESSYPYAQGASSTTQVLVRGTGE